jgi:hypothetical protein
VLYWVKLSCELAFLARDSLPKGGHCQFFFWIVPIAATIRARTATAIETPALGVKCSCADRDMVCWRLRLKQASNRPIPANHQSKENYTKARILHQGLDITSIELCFQYKRLWNSTAITYRLLAVMLMSTGTLFLSR